MTPDPASSPALVWVGIISAIVISLLTGSSKAIALGTALLDSLGVRRRRLAVERDDADIAELRRQVATLEESLSQTRGEFAEYRRVWDERERRWADEWRHHREWDYRAQEALIGRQPPFDRSPPFMSPDPTATPGGTP